MPAAATSQFDEVALAMLRDSTVRELARADGLDPGALVTLYVDALNQAIDGAPRGRHLRHPYVPRQLQGPLSVERGGYDGVAEQLFDRGAGQSLPAGIRHAARRRFRAAALRATRQGRRAGAGELEGAALEPADLLARRIEEASGFIDGDRLGISPQCGFASTVAGNPLSEDDMRAKLARCVEVAKAVWGQIAMPTPDGEVKLAPFRNSRSFRKRYANRLPGRVHSGRDRQTCGRPLEQ